MSDLISLVMKTAARELLHQEACQVDQEMQELLAEMARDPVSAARLAEFAQRFFTLLKRRCAIAQRAMGIRDAEFFGIFGPSIGLDAEHPAHAHAHAHVSADRTEDDRCREMLKQLAGIYQELSEQAEQANNALRRDPEPELNKAGRGDE